MMHKLRSLFPGLMLLAAFGPRGMYDANLVLQDAVTKTATFNGASLDLKTGTPRRGMKARLLVTAVSGTTPTLDGKIQESDDGSTWNDLVSFEQITAAGQKSRSFDTSKRYIRFVATIGGTTPSFTYRVDLGLARP